MESKKVNPQLELESAYQQQCANDIQQPEPCISTKSDEFLQIKRVDLRSLHQPTPSLNSTNGKTPNKTASQWFKLFIALCIEDSDDSIETILNHVNLIMPCRFAILSAKQIFRCLDCSIECLYNRFDKLNMIKNIFCVIYEDTRLTKEAKMNAFFKRICSQKIQKIKNNLNWNEIVMFGALLCELSTTYHGQSTLFITKLNVWIEEIIKSALGGSQSGFNAFKLILNRLKQNETMFKDINRGYFHILDTLLGDEDYESKLQTIDSYLSPNVGSFNNDDSTLPIDNSNPTDQKKRLIAPKSTKIDETEYLEEIEYSQKCKEFDEFLNSTSKGVNDCCDFFSDATNIELEYFARQFIEFAIQHPEQVKILGSTASKFQSALLRVRKFIKDIISSLISQFEVMKENKKVDSVKFLNFAKFLGELYVSEKPIVPNYFMAEFLTFLKSNGEFITLASTLKLCGYVYEDKQEEHFKNLMDSFVFREIVEDEITKIAESFDNYYGMYESRLFKPREFAIKIKSLESVLNSILKNQDVQFSYELLELLHINTKGLNNMLIESLQKPDANVIEVAKFLKSLNEFSHKIAKFMKGLKVNMKLKIFDLSTDNLKDMKALGMIIAELSNLNVINDNQKIWLEEVKRFESDDIFEVIEVYVDVASSMLITIQIYEFEELLDVNQYLQDINNSLESYNTETASKIKSKIAQIFQNIVLKKVDIPTSELIFKIRHFQRFEGLPKDMPERSENDVDLHDFTKIFYVNAISNYLFTENFAKSLKFITPGPKGAQFIQCLRDTLSSNIFPNIFAPDFCESDEAPGTFELIAHLFKEDVLKESEIKSFLEIIYEIENYGNCRTILTRILDDLQLIIEKRARRYKSKLNQEIQECVQKVQKKLELLEVKTKEPQKEGKFHEIDNNYPYSSHSEPRPARIHRSNHDLNEDNLKVPSLASSSILTDQASDKLITTDFYAQNAAQHLLKDIKYSKSKSTTTKNDHQTENSTIKVITKSISEDNANLLPTNQELVKIYNQVLTQVTEKSGGESSKGHGQSRQETNHSSGHSSQINEHSSGKSSQKTDHSSWQLSLVTEHSSGQSSEVNEHSSGHLSQVTEHSSGESSKGTKRSSLESSQVNKKSSGESNQVIDQSSGQSSLVIKNSSEQSSQVTILDSSSSLSTDAQVRFYINQLNESNIVQIKNGICTLLTKNCSRKLIIDILFQKSISDQACTELAVDLIKGLIDNENCKKIMKRISLRIHIELNNICKEGGDQDEKMINLVIVIIKFDLYFQEYFWFEIWRKLFNIVGSCQSSVKALVLLMIEKITKLNKIEHHKNLMRKIVVLFKNKLVTEVNKDLIDKMNNLIKTIEKGLNSTNKVDDQATHSIAVFNNITNVEEKIVKNTIKEVSNNKVQLEYTKIQSTINESFIQNHQDDAVRPLNFLPDSFLFNDLVANPQAFKIILKTLFEDCKSLEINKDNSIKIKEFIAVAIIKINLLKTHPKSDEINKYAEIFFKLYTKLDQTKFMQWVLMKLLKAWKLFDLTYGADSLIPDEKKAKIYDRYSKSVVRITKSFTISNTNAIQNDKSDGKSSSLDNITSKTKNLQTVSDIARITDNITSNTDDQKTKSKTVNSRTITLKFDDIVAKSDKSSSPAFNLKHDDVKLKFNDRSLKSNDITSTSGDLTLKSGDITSKSGDSTSKFGDLTSKSEDITSKSGDSTSKFRDITSKFGDLTSKSGDLTSKSGDITSKFGDITSKSGDLTSKSGNITSKFGDITSKSDDLTSKSGDLTSKSDNITSKSISSKLFNFFMTCLQNLLLKNLIDTTVDVDRDPYFDYFLYKKRRTYEIVCDLHFHDLISSNFIFHCITKMFQNPLIIDKSLDVVVRLMILVESFIIIRHKSNDFNYILQDVKTFWSRLPFGVELLYPISVDKWTFLKNFIQKSLFFRVNQVEFSGVIEKMWTELMENPGKFNEIVQIFEDFLEVFGDSFAVLIVDFMENRRNSLEKFPIDNILKPISLKYKTSILFAFELFEMEILNCELFSKWLNDKIYGKLVQEHNSEILLKFGRNGLKIDGNLDENLINYYKKLNNFG